MSALDVRGIPRALLGSGAGLRHRLEEWDAAIRGPLGTARRVAVVSWEPGVGTTTVASRLVGTIARRRGGAVLGVDAAGAGAGLAALRGAAATPSRAARASARTTAEATSGLPVGPDGERILFPAVAADLVVAAWIDDVAPIARFFDVTITDFGVRDPRTDLAVVAALSDVVCLVSSADRPTAELARSLAAGLAELPERPRPVLALVEPLRQAQRPEGAGQRPEGAGQRPEGAGQRPEGAGQRPEGPGQRPEGRSRGSEGRGLRPEGRGRGPEGGGRRVAESVAALSAFPVVRIPADRGISRGGAVRTLAARRSALELAAAVVAGGGSA